VDPGYVLSIDLSIKFALMCIIGGLATPAGPILGAVLITALEIYLRAKWGGARSGLYLIVYGCLLILVVRVMPEGVLAGVPSLFKRWRGRAA
jgi:branched-chain amino acid transport system permease protein